MPDSMTPQTPTEALATALQTVLRQNIGTNAPLRDFERRASDLLAALTAAGYSLRPTEEDIDDPLVEVQTRLAALPQSQEPR